MVNGKPVPKTSSRKEVKDDPVTAYEEVKKDLNSLTTEEQMDIVYRLGSSVLIVVPHFLLNHLLLDNSSFPHFPTSGLTEVSVNYIFSSLSL